VCIPFLEEILIECSIGITSSLLLNEDNILTCANHGDGGLYINPLICIDARMNKNKTIEVGLLYPTQSIFDGVIILQEKGTNTFRQSVFTLTIQRKV